MANIDFETCLEQYDVRAVVIEFPSTPLLEAIGKDIEIFLMADPVLSFSQEALSLLKKRVHYFEEIKELQRALIEWKDGDLPPLRDQTFYHKYLFRENTEALILNTIENCIAHRH